MSCNKSDPEPCTNHSRWPQMPFCRTSIDPSAANASSFAGLNGSIQPNLPRTSTSFLPGDWICPSENCAAHNFRRNLTCIACGCPRFPATDTPHDQIQAPHLFSLRLAPAAPFTTAPNSLLTPSGRAFASCGKVQNISSDPFSPCIMYWPDNEPFPEPGQIRPSGLMGVPASVVFHLSLFSSHGFLSSQPPPIINTGNRGPISHQSGDWICLKCNYLNWRRRKVCQTCFPYAEGNEASIPIAMQLERIAPLTSMLAQTGLSPAPQLHGSIHGSQSSRSEVGEQSTQHFPIYQKPPHHAGPDQCHHLPGPLRDASPVEAFDPVVLLPSFLQNIVRSSKPLPATSSAILPFLEYEESVPSLNLCTPSVVGSLTGSLISNIWRLDEDESKVLPAAHLSRAYGQQPQQLQASIIHASVRRCTHFDSRKPFLAGSLAWLASTLSAVLAARLILNMCEVADTDSIRHPDGGYKGPCTESSLVGVCCRPFELQLADCKIISRYPSTSHQDFGSFSWDILEIVSFNTKVHLDYSGAPAKRQILVSIEISFIFGGLVTCNHHHRFGGGDDYGHWAPPAAAPGEGKGLGSQDRLVLSRIGGIARPLTVTARACAEPPGATWWLFRHALPGGSTAISAFGGSPVALRWLKYDIIYAPYAHP
ncbi:hypothetical protein B0H13DRAFT_2261818 [Mycena leptocephala]|nr:hypothetical protein B0H13DRAFT_2261818 [Mycena leptocephala]